MLFSLLKHYLDTDTVLKVFQSLYCFITSISHGVENYFPRLWGTGITDAIFTVDVMFRSKKTLNIQQYLCQMVYRGMHLKLYCKLWDILYKKKTHKFSILFHNIKDEQSLVMSHDISSLTF